VRACNNYVISTTNARTADVTHRIVEYIENIEEKRKRRVVKLKVPTHTHTDTRTPTHTHTHGLSQKRKKQQYIIRGTQKVTERKGKTPAKNEKICKYETCVIFKEQEEAGQRWRKEEAEQFVVVACDI